VGAWGMDESAHGHHREQQPECPPRPGGGQRGGAASREREGSTCVGDMPTPDQLPGRYLYGCEAS
jgi:hypothetical protein